MPPGIFLHVNVNKCAVFSHEVGALFRGVGAGPPRAPLTLSTGMNQLLYLVITRALLHCLKTLFIISGLSISILSIILFVLNLIEVKLMLCIYHQRTWLLISSPNLLLGTNLVNSKILCLGSNSV